MEQSSGVQEAMRNFYARFSAQDASAFAQHLAEGAGVLIIGTAPTDWWQGRQQCADAFAEQVAALPGLTFEAGEIQGWEEGNIGWAADQPTFVFPDGNRIPVRLTAILRREEGTWRALQMHASVGVPDEALSSVVAEHQS